MEESQSDSSHKVSLSTPYFYRSGYLSIYKICEVTVRHRAKQEGLPELVCRFIHALTLLLPEIKDSQP